MENTFIQASREQLRFETNKGYLSVEDLWSLSLVNLDALAVAINASLSSGSGSFLKNPSVRRTQEQKDQALRLDVLKAIIEVRQDENAQQLATSKSDAQKIFLKDLLQKKKLAAMESLSTEDIEAQLAALNQ